MLKLFDTTVTWKYSHHHWKWHKQVKLSEEYHQEKSDIYYLYCVWKNCNIKVLTTPDNHSAHKTHIFHASQKLLQVKGSFTSLAPSNVVSFTGFPQNLKIWKGFWFWKIFSRFWSSIGKWVCECFQIVEWKHAVFCGVICLSLHVFVTLSQKLPIFLLG